MSESPATNAYHGILIPASIRQRPTLAEPDSFDHMKKLMGIDIAEVHYESETRPGFTMWADEEGLLKQGAEINYNATALLADLEGVNHPVVGPIFITGTPTEEGVQAPLSKELAEKIMGHMDFDIQARLKRVRAVNEQMSHMR